METPNPQPATPAPERPVSAQALRYPDFRILWIEV